MGDEYTKLIGVRRQASFLKDELSTIKALLEKLELMDELDPLAKNWRDHVREMSYDMENCIDDFMRDLGGADAKKGFIRKTAKRLKTLRKRHHIAHRMEELKVLALEANERRMRYKIDDCINSTSRIVLVDPRMSAIYKEAAGLVGIDGPKKELVSCLADTQENLKVVAIVGFGGLGKTTLAKQVYDEIGGQFSCKAFISISQRPDMASLLSGLQLKLGMKEESSHAREVQDIVGCLREHLTHKRYLVVIDDLWDQSTWNIMGCIFPEVDNASRVIVTTRVDGVAIWACHSDPECVYRMRPLKEQDSRKLFFKRVFGSEYDCPPQFKVVSSEILKKCGGLPLAIITIASLLASRQARSKDEWESIRISLGAKFAATPTLKEMRSILNLSYMHLPLHLRPCLLYLGMYPEDHEILMRDLVLQWVAEGFVSNTHGSDMEDVVKSYFNELINRSMIQPEKSIGDEAVVSCKVHDMMLDLIVSKCEEENFISVACNWEDFARMHAFEHKVRRLSLNPSCNDVAPRVTHASMSQVRSFSQFGESKYTPPLSLFKHLRVLVYEFSYKKGTTLDLTHIGQLFQLRYLKVVAFQCIVHLPTEILELVHLETLQIASRSVQNFPSDIVFLPRLSQLTLPKGIGLPQGIKSMKSLRALNCFDIGKSSLEDIDGLGKLTNLRILVFLGKVTVEVVDALLCSIGKLYELRLLIVHGEPSKHYCDLIYSFSNPPLLIKKIYLRGWLLKRIPNWIGNLHYLGSLSLSVERLSTEEVNVVGKLPSLVELCLWVTHITEDSGAAIACTGLFPILVDLRLFSEDGDDATICMEFEAGVMPNLRLLGLEICDKWGGAMPLGMEHLLALEHIHIGVRSSIHKRRDVETAFRTAADVFPKRPSIT
uniref:Disease resistance protein RPP13 n=1 Tax=Triticum urartu TaxID=4572 RepID=A0A8R7QL40_TRIUA